jgi:tellurite methyltransferase
MEGNLSVEFFRHQFDRQIETTEYRLNPFEEAVLPHVSGRLLELGCGLGNLAIAAARRGIDVTALEGCENAVADLQRRARAEALPLYVQVADLVEWRAAEQYDTVVSIGLLMFFTCDDGRRVLQEIRRAVRPGGVAAVNVLVEGTTFMAMFDPRHFCLFPADELARTFADWEILLHRRDEFPADGAVKRFATVVARRPR